MYIKIIGEEEKYNVTLQPFTTQHGYRGVKFVGEEIPDTDKGFMAYDDNDEVIGDLSEFTYLYKPNQYSVAEDIIESPSGNDKPLPPNPLDVRLSRMSAQINSITPYTETKRGYYGEIEKVFYNVPDGNTTIFFDNYSGDYDVKRIENRLTVSFPERLTDATDITVMVQ